MGVLRREEGSLCPAPSELVPLNHSIFGKLHLRNTSLSAKIDPRPRGQGHLELKKEVRITWT